MKRRNKVIIVVLLLVVGFIALNVVVPIYIRCYKGYNCRLCGAKKSELTVHIWGILVYKKTGKIQETIHTKLYDKYIAEPHEHQWAGGGLGRYTRYIFCRREIHSLGAHWGEYSTYQYRLACDVLSVMGLFKREPVEFRREVFHELIECEEEEDYERVRQFIEAIRASPENSRKLYEVYRQQKAKPLR